MTTKVVRHVRNERLVVRLAVVTAGGCGCIVEVADHVPHRGGWNVELAVREPRPIQHRPERRGIVRGEWRRPVRTRLHRVWFGTGPETVRETGTRQSCTELNGRMAVAGECHQGAQTLDGREALIRCRRIRTVGPRPDDPRGSIVIRARHPADRTRVAPVAKFILVASRSRSWRGRSGTSRTRNPPRAPRSRTALFRSRGVAGAARKQRSPRART